MYTLLLPGRSLLISDDARDRLVRALETNRPLETIAVEMNGDGGGDWEVTVNLRQVIALVRHSAPAPLRAGAAPRGETSARPRIAH